MSFRPIRVRSSFPVFSRLLLIFDNGANGGSYQIERSWSDFLRIADQINPRRGGKEKRAMGYCRHEKVKATILINDVSWVAQNGHFVTTTNRSDYYLSVMQPGGSIYNRTGFPGWMELLGEFSATPAYQNLCLSAFNKQIQQVPTTVSLANFLYELKDFKEIAKSLSKVPSLLKNGALTQQVSKPALKPRQLPKRVAKSGVDTFLSWNFAWAPFIGDLQALSKVGENVYKRLNYLRSIRGKDTTIRYSVPDAYQHPMLGQTLWTYDNGPTGAGVERVVLQAYHCTFVSTWRLNHNLKELDDAWSSFRATLASLGLNNPVKVVWNAIPFSFLLDWVGPVGKWLDRAAVQPFTGQWDISDVTSSVHEEFTFAMNLQQYVSGTNGTILTVKVDKYTRLDGLPLTLGAFDFSQLTDTQQKLALSIPLSRILK